MTNVRDLLERAIALEQRGEHAAARRLYEQVLAEVPEHPGALLKIALFEQAAGELGAAHAMLERALRAAQTSRMPTAPIRLAFAGLAESANDPAAARAAYQQALAEAPGHPAAAFGLGRLALREGDSSAATKHCRAGLAVAPAHAGLLTTLGHALRLSGALAAAAEALGAAAAATPDDAAAWLAFGNACMEAELAQVEAARGAVSAAPNTAIARSARARHRRFRTRGRVAAGGGRTACASRDGGTLRLRVAAIDARGAGPSRAPCGRRGAFRVFADDGGGASVRSSRTALRESAAGRGRRCPRPLHRTGSRGVAIACAWAICRPTSTTMPPRI